MSTGLSYNQIFTIVQEGSETLSQFPYRFQQWIEETLTTISPTEWYLVILGIGNTVTLAKYYSPSLRIENYEQATCQAVFDLVIDAYEKEARLIYGQILNYTLTSNRNLLKTDDLIANLTRLLYSKGMDKKVRKSIIIRELMHEINPTDEDNLLSLMVLYSKRQEIASVKKYAQIYVANILVSTNLIDPGSRRFLGIFQSVSQIFDQGYMGIALGLIYELCLRTPADSRASFLTWLSVISEYYSPEDYPLYKEISNFSDLYQTTVVNLWEVFFRNTNQRGYSLMARAFEQASEQVSQSLDRQYLQANLVAYICLSTHAAYYFSLSGLSRETVSMLNKIRERLPTLDLLDSFFEELSFSNKQLYIEMILFVFCYCLPYVYDDPILLYTYQLAAAKQYSKSISLSYPDLIWEPPCQLPTFIDRPLRVGYLSTGFRRHSVGYLSHQVISHHRHEYVQAYCYQYEITVNPLDPIYRDLQKNAFCFRDLSRQTVQDIVNTVRSDQLDILVYLDSLTSTLGCQLIALRLAPIQISWLGGDTPGLPEIDYVLMDQQIITPEIQSQLSECCIPLTVFTAVDELTVPPEFSSEFRRRLGGSNNTVIYWSAAIAHKRSFECIQAQVEILEQVPDSLLVIKGAGDFPSVMDQYQQVVQHKDVADRLRFVAMASEIEIHRVQLSCADLILDTFPYTGATHTVESLYMGVPVLTKVGRHYYGRMSFSLLKTCDLDICITYSVEDYISRGVQLGRDPLLLSQVKQKVQDSKQRSALWDARTLSHSLESIYQQLYDPNNR